jgi:hypothetical protein
VEPLYCVMNLADLASKQQQAEVLFAETLPRCEEVLKQLGGEVKSVYLTTTNT